MARARFRLGTIYELSLSLVLALLQGCFLGVYGYPPSCKTIMSKYQFALYKGPAWKPTDAASSLNIKQLFPAVEEASGEYLPSTSYGHEVE